MEEKNNADRLENVTVYETYLKNPNIVRVFEIGKGPREKSRVTEYDKKTGKELCEYYLEKYGAGDEESISEVESFLITLLDNRKLLQKKKSKTIRRGLEFLRRHI